MLLNCDCTKLANFWATVCTLPCVRELWPNVWMDQDETWHAGRPQPWPQGVSRGPPRPPPQNGRGSPSFRPMSSVYCGDGRPSQLLLSSC